MDVSKTNGSVSGGAHFRHGRTGAVGSYVHDEDDCLDARQVMNQDVIDALGSRQQCSCSHWRSRRCSSPWWQPVHSQATASANGSNTRLPHNNPRCICHQPTTSNSYGNHLFSYRNDPQTHASNTIHDGLYHTSDLPTMSTLSRLAVYPTTLPTFDQLKNPNNLHTLLSIVTIPQMESPASKEGNGPWSLISTPKSEFLEKIRRIKFFYAQFIFICAVFNYNPVFPTKSANLGLTMHISLASSRDRANYHAHATILMRTSPRSNHE